MSTSFLYHGFGIRGYHYVRSRYEFGHVVFTLDQDRFSLRCPVCKGRNLTLKGKTLRKFRTLPIGTKPVFIELGVQRVLCHRCGITRQVNVKFADVRRTYTLAFERYVLDLSKHMTIKDTAELLGVSWDIVKDIQRRYLQKHFSKPVLKGLKLIAIDEICIGKGHKYLTVVLNLETGAVVFVGDGKGAAALVPFWKRLKHSKAKIKAVAIDMSPAYIAAVLDNLPKSKIVFDRFHIQKLFNDKLSDLRRAVQREAQGPLQQDVLKGTRWLLLKNSENLDQDKDESDRLEKALSLNKPLATAYYLKEDLRQLWDQPSKIDAERFLADWRKRAKASGIAILQKFANTLVAHSFGIFTWFDCKISTGPLEGTNNKIKTMKRQAYGFRDKEFFKLKIYGLHRTKYALVG